MIPGHISQVRFPYNHQPITIVMLSIIVATAQNRAIGYKNKLLYWLPDDLKRFKSLTTGHTIIMGRKTFESLPKGALPNRRNIVLSKQASFQAQDTEVFHSLEDALKHCQTTEEVFIIGGESIYREALDKSDRIYLTLIEDTPQEADAYFPEITDKDWQLVSSVEHPADEKHQFTFRFQDYTKRQ